MPEIVPANRRGGFALLHNEFRYVRRNKTKSTLYWQCSTTGCGAYLHTNLFDVSDDNAVINGM